MASRQSAIRDRSLGREQTRTGVRMAQLSPLWAFTGVVSGARVWVECNERHSQLGEEKLDRCPRYLSK